MSVINFIRENHCTVTDSNSRKNAIRIPRNLNGLSGCPSSKTGRDTCSRTYGRRLVSAITAIRQWRPLSSSRRAPCGCMRRFTGFPSPESFDDMHNIQPLAAEQHQGTSFSCILDAFCFLQSKQIIGAGLENGTGNLSDPIISFLPSPLQVSSLFPMELLSLFVGEYRTKRINAKPHSIRMTKTDCCTIGFLSGFGL